jgi:hypothetical protein
VQLCQCTSKTQSPRGVRRSCRPRRTTSPFEATAKTRRSRYHEAHWSGGCRFGLIRHPSRVAATRAHPFLGNMTTQSPVPLMLPEVGGTAPPWLYAVAVDERVRPPWPVARLALSQNRTASPRRGWGTRIWRCPPTSGRGIAVARNCVQFCIDLHRPELPPQLGSLRMYDTARIGGHEWNDEIWYINSVIFHVWSELQQHFP